jgi:hypothetical protein
VAQGFETVFAGDGIRPGISRLVLPSKRTIGRMSVGLQTEVDEIAPDIFRLYTRIPDITEHGFTFNQFLLTGDEPFLLHHGHRQLFPSVSEAINRVVPLEKLRRISSGQVHADECGAVNLLLDAAPNPEVVHGVRDTGGAVVRRGGVALAGRRPAHPCRLHSNRIGGRGGVPRHQADDEPRADGFAAMAGTG